MGVKKREKLTPQEISLLERMDISSRGRNTITNILLGQRKPTDSTLLYTFLTIALLLITTIMLYAEKFTGAYTVTIKDTDITLTLLNTTIFALHILSLYMVLLYRKKSKNSLVNKNKINFASLTYLYPENNPELDKNIAYLSIITLIAIAVNNFVLTILLLIAFNYTKKNIDNINVVTKHTIAEIEEEGD